MNIRTTIARDGRAPSRPSVVRRHDVRSQISFLRVERIVRAFDSTFRSRGWRTCYARTDVTRSNSFLGVRETRRSSTRHISRILSRVRSLERTRYVAREHPLRGTWYTNWCKVYSTRARRLHEELRRIVFVREQIQKYFSRVSDDPWTDETRRTSECIFLERVLYSLRLQKCRHLGFTATVIQRILGRILTRKCERDTEEDSRFAGSILDARKLRRCVSSFV